MAWITQEQKKAMAEKMKPLLKKYGMKGSLAVERGAVLHLNLRSGPLDLIGQINKRNAEFEAMGRPSYTGVVTNASLHHNRVDNFEGPEKEFLEKAFEIMAEGNHDNSDSMSDYFDVGWYYYIEVGKWDKPYELVKE
jgi:hypothetical protein